MRTSSIADDRWPASSPWRGGPLRRAAIWSTDIALTAEDVREALLPVASDPFEAILGRTFNVDLPGILKTVASHYLERAMEDAHGNKTEAAKLVGLRSYQTLTNWLARYGV